MYKTILIPLDGSPRSAGILGHLSTCLGGLNAEIILFHVIEPRVLKDVGEDAPRLRAAAEEYLAGKIEVLEQEGLNARFILSEGNAPDEILQAAQLNKADLIAMASHGWSGIDRLLHGSVTEKILRNSPATVFAVRSYVSEPDAVVPRERSEGPIQLKHIVVPLDGSTNAEQILDDAVEVAKATGAKIRLVRAVERLPAIGLSEFTSPQETEVSEVESYLERIADGLREYGHLVETRVTAGSAVSTVLELAVDPESDLIAMTTHGRTGVDRWLLGSVTESLLRSTPVPLLIRRIYS